jgi:hypothetical protein
VVESVNVVGFGFGGKVYPNKEKNPLARRNNWFLCQELMLLMKQ